MTDEQNILARILDEITGRLDIIKTDFPKNQNDLRLLSKEYVDEINEEVILLDKLDQSNLTKLIKNELSFWKVIQNLVYGSYQKQDVQKINEMKSLVIDSLTKIYKLLRK